MKNGLLFTFYLLFIFSCSDLDDLIPKQEKKKSLVDQYIELTKIYNMWGCSSLRSKEIVVDNEDETISIATTYYRIETIAPCFQALPGDRKEYRIKKCIQGQVYRSEQNDCKGTGSASDYYGAQKYQWCPTNDTACDDRISSPAHTTCLNDTTAGISWEIAVFLDGNPYYDYIKTRGDEIPSSESDYYWTSGVILPNDSTKTDAQLLIENNDITYFLKSTYLYVLCIEKTEN